MTTMLYLMSFIYIILYQLVGKEKLLLLPIWLNLLPLLPLLYLLLLLRVLQLLPEILPNPNLHLPHPPLLPLLLLQPRMVLPIIKRRNNNNSLNFNHPKLNNRKNHNPILPSKQRIRRNLTVSFLFYSTIELSFENPFFYPPHIFMTILSSPNLNI